MHPIQKATGQWIKRLQTKKEDYLTYREQRLKPGESGGISRVTERFQDYNCLAETRPD